MKQKFFLNIFLFGLSLLLAVSCCSYEAKPDFYITKQNTTNVGEYAIAEISVHKRGFWLFWIIPFKRGCEEFAKDLMETEAKKVYPSAVGISSYEVTDDINLSLFSWVTGTKAKGRIVIKR